METPIHFQGWEDPYSRYAIKHAYLLSIYDPYTKESRLRLGGVLEKRTHLVKWKIVCTSKEKGGLCIRCLGLSTKPS